MRLVVVVGWQPVLFVYVPHIGETCASNDAQPCPDLVEADDQSSGFPCPPLAAPKSSTSRSVEWQQSQQHRRARFPPNDMNPPEPPTRVPQLTPVCSRNLTISKQNLAMCTPAGRWRM